jgi:glycosyltransferase involved in cell wall biosynthesis
MRAPLLIDLSHTSHTQARTGVQRVTRSLFRVLDTEAMAITHDPYLRRWRALEPWEEANLMIEGAAAKRGARWPLFPRIRSRLRRSFGHGANVTSALRQIAASSPGLIVPEIFSPAAAAAFPDLFTAVRGPRVALFHDAIALQFPELTPPKTVARFPAYLAELLAFDGIAAVSEDSREILVDYWRWLGVANTPPVTTISLGMDTQPKSQNGGNPPMRTADEAPVILSVGSIEGRKNHLALLEACESIWARGGKFSLHLIGLAQPQTAAAALARIRELERARRPIRYDGPVTDAALETAYAGCTLTVYPSLVEGFGLPVLESLAHGRPCICSGRRALGEAARGGGCVMLDRVDAPSLADALSRLLTSPHDLEILAREARTRRFRTWSDYASDLRLWMQELPVR